LRTMIAISLVAALSLIAGAPLTAKVAPIPLAELARQARSSFIPGVASWYRTIGHTMPEVLSSLKLVSVRERVTGAGCTTNGGASPGDQAFDQRMQRKRCVIS